MVSEGRACCKVVWMGPLWVGSVSLQKDTGHILYSPLFLSTNVNTRREGSWADHKRVPGQTSDLASWSWAMRNTHFISLPFSDTLQPWTTMTWAASCPLSFISLKGDQASFQLRLLTMPQNDEGFSTCEKQKNVPSHDQPRQWDCYEPNLNTLEISFAMWITKGDTHKETTIMDSSWKQKSCATKKHPGQSISDFIHSTTCYWLSIFKRVQ